MRVISTNAAVLRWAAANVVAVGCLGCAPPRPVPTKSAQEPKAAQSKPVPRRAVAFEEPSGSEKHLHQLINQYLAALNLPSIPLSRSLSFVARTHARDSTSQRAVGQCNLHSWSQAGTWTRCCYTPDHAQAECMWRKPRELTNYTAFGYEISAGTSQPSGALNLWRTSAPHNAVITNQGMWSGRSWRSVGVGINGTHAHVWLGEEVDPDGYWTK